MNGLKTTNYNPINYYVETLNKFVEVYRKEGGFINGHDDELDTAPVMAIMADGTVIPLYSRCSMNPLSIKYKDSKDEENNSKYLYLSTMATAATFAKTHATWEESINAYNASIENWWISGTRYYIVAYVEL